MRDELDHSTLRYVEAAQLEGPFGGLEDASLLGTSGEQLGSLAGALIDPGEGRLRYYVIHSTGWIGRREYLVPADFAPSIAPDGSALHVDMDRAALAACETFHPAAAVPYSDDDLIATIFRDRDDDVAAALSA